MAFPLSPTQFADPSFALTPALMPYAGIRDARTVPGPPDDAGGDLTGGAAVGAEAEGGDGTVMKVLGGLPPPFP